MNRLISTNVESVSLDQLPPGARCGPARVLFLNSNIYGIRSIAAELRRYTAESPAVDAVHIDLAAPLWLKVAGKSLPGSRGWDLHEFRHLHLWGRLIGSWLDGPLPLERFDVIHVMSQGMAWAVPKRLTSRSGRPGFIIKIDSTAAQHVSEYGMNSANRAPFIAAEQRMFEAADLTIADSEWAATSVKADYGLPAERVYTASMGVGIPEQRAITAARRDDGPTRIVFVGNGVKRKGVDLLIAAHQAAVADRAELHIVGNNRPMRRGAPNVVWHGPVARSDVLATVLPSMDLFAIASRIDMLPVAAVEAAAAGLPVVAPRLAGFPELVIDGVTGSLFEREDQAGLAQALVRLVDDPDLRTRMGRNARAHVERHFDAAKVYPAWIDRIVGVANERNPVSKES